MSKKHYIAVAEMFRVEHERLAADNANLELSAPARVQARAGLEAVERCILGFANVACADNSRFDRARFFAACGMQY